MKRFLLLFFVFALFSSTDSVFAADVDVGEQFLVKKENVKLDLQSLDLEIEAVADFSLNELNNVASEAKLEVINFSELDFTNIKDLEKNRIWVHNINNNYTEPIFDNFLYIHRCKQTL